MSCVVKYGGVHSFLSVVRQFVSWLNFTYFVPCITMLCLWIERRTCMHEEVGLSPPPSLRTSPPAPCLLPPFLERNFFLFSSPSLFFSHLPPPTPSSHSSNLLFSLLPPFTSSFPPLHLSPRSYPARPLMHAVWRLFILTSNCIPNRSIALVNLRESSDCHYHQKVIRQSYVWCRILYYPMIVRGVYEHYWRTALGIVLTKLYDKVCRCLFPSQDLKHTPAYRRL